MDKAATMSVREDMAAIKAHLEAIDNSLQDLKTFLSKRSATWDAAAYDSKLLIKLFWFCAASLVTLGAAVAKGMLR